MVKRLCGLFVLFCLFLCACPQTPPSGICPSGFEVASRAETLQLSKLPASASRIQPIEGGSRLVVRASAPEWACAMDCKGDRVPSYVDDHVECAARPRAPAPPPDSAIAMARPPDPAASRQPGDDARCLNPPCWVKPDPDGDTPCRGRDCPTPTPKTEYKWKISPLIVIDIAAGALVPPNEIANNDALKSMVGPAPHVESLKEDASLFGIWNHPPASTEDFQAGLRDYKGLRSTEEFLALIVPTALVYQKAKEAYPDLVGLELVPRNLIKIWVNYKCQNGICPIVGDAVAEVPMKLVDTVEGKSKEKRRKPGAGDVKIKQFNLSPGSVVCSIIYPIEPISFGITCLGSLTTQMAAGLEGFPLDFPIPGAAETYAKLNYTRAEVFDGKAFIFGASLLGIGPAE